MSDYVFIKQKVNKASVSYKCSDLNCPATMNIKKSSIAVTYSKEHLADALHEKPDTSTAVPLESVLFQGKFSRINSILVSNSEEKPPAIPQKRKSTSGHDRPSKQTKFRDIFDLVDPRALETATNYYSSEIESLNYIKIEVNDTMFVQNRYNIHAKFQEFLNKEDKKVCVLCGESGQGKTTFCKSITHEMLASPREYLPVYGDLSVIPNCETSFIEHTLGFYQAEISQLQDSNILFILDGYDELQIKNNLVNSNKFFEKFPNCKVLITCNTASIISFVPYQDGIPLYSSLFFLYVQPLTHECIYNILEGNQQTAIIEDDSDLSKLLGNTHNLSMFCQIAQIDWNDRVSKYRLFYEYFVYMFKGIQGMELQFEEYLEFCMDLALKQHENKYFTRIDIENEAFTKYKHAIPIQNALWNEDTLQFKHSSFMNFFIAQKVRFIIEGKYGVNVDRSILDIVDMEDKDELLDFVNGFLTKDHQKVLFVILTNNSSKPDYTKKIEQAMEAFKLTNN